MDQDDSEEDFPEWKTIVKAVNGMMRETTAPHSKSNMTNLMETLKGDWKAKKLSKFIYPVLVEEEALEDVNIEGEPTTKLKP